LLSHTKETFDRLTEISPLIPDSVVREFKSKFKDTKDVARPEEANGLEKIEVFVQENPLRQRPSTLERMETLGLPSPVAP
jgi:hypothetical protein